jgi:hypothetical protein
VEEPTTAGCRRTGAVGLTGRRRIDGQAPAAHQRAGGRDGCGGGDGRSWSVVAERVRVGGRGARPGALDQVKSPNFRRPPPSRGKLR